MRAAIWVRGCSIRCAGCINPHLFTTQGATLVDSKTLVDDARNAGGEGLTLLGGGPLDQVAAGTSLAVQARELGLGVICFTGYSIESLTRPEHLKLFENIDLLVDGAYVASEPERLRAWVGSTNQRFIHITDRYSEYDTMTARNRPDIRINADGTIDGAGFLEGDALSSLTHSRETRSKRR